MPNKGKACRVRLTCHDWTIVDGKGGAMSTNSVRWTAALLAMFLGIATSRLATPQATPQPAAHPPSLLTTCLITSDLNRLTVCYARVLQLQPHSVGDDYV